MKGKSVDEMGTTVVSSSSFPTTQMVAFLFLTRHPHQKHTFEGFNHFLPRLRFGDHSTLPVSRVWEQSFLFCSSKLKINH